MTKSNLTRRLAKQNPQRYERDCEAIVKAILGRLVDALGAGDRVEIRGFGAFSVKERRARTGRNPRTGEAVAVSERKSLTFKPGKEMGRRLNPRGECLEGVGGQLLQAS
ncbi:HU family DNA-binding protein [Methylobacterium nigriterrae]|uniref:HU family DNA-binding protein n=1 Tax=Methylobacterium nigriterrae TaxID=3127512 RepID=UPI0030132F94